MEYIKNEGSIKAIDKTTVHRICSGQVVLNLATAVKELVENALDAGATVVDVRLKEYGSESIEVSDNGDGVLPSNFKGLTLKHHTSKLRDFSDLTFVETFGFRGEALSSLCALSELSIVTRHISENCGTALCFDRNGHIIDRKQHARQVGTTVTLSNLFSALPVRQKEFHKNLKREFNKMTQLLSAYCLVSTDVKITCVNQSKNNTRTTFLSTQGCKTIKENISCLFGAKQLTTLLEIKQRLPSTEILEELRVTEEDCSTFSLEGYISSCAHGSGRGSSDRQYYFINSRPCEPAKIMKQVNEVYHQFNTNQYPFVFLNITVSRGSVDVNVTPDKRKIFLTEEKLLLAIIKVSVLGIFEKIPSTFSYNNVSPLISKTRNCDETDKKPNFSKFDAWRHRSDEKRKNDVFLDEPLPKKQIKTESANEGILERFFIKKAAEKVLNNTSGAMKNSTKTILPSELNRNVSTNSNEKIQLVKKEKDTNLKTEILTNSLEIKNVEQNILESSMCDKDDQKCQKNTRYSGLLNTSISLPIAEDSMVIPEETLPFLKEMSPVTDELELAAVDDSIDSVSDGGHNSEQDSTNRRTSLDIEANNLAPIKFDELEERGVRSICMPVDLETIKKSFHKRITKSNSSKEVPALRFRAVIDPSKNQQAENELSKEISKDMFLKMKIIGQFNLGFIITKLDSDLFIIDQHATDEKYNFETLQQTTVISNQKLVSPQVLELTAANECVVMENVDIFNKNGFEFQIDETAAPTRRISLTAIPMSKNWIFGKDDIDELIFMLQDSPGANCRPSRVRSMFASRACRKSVMIGTALGEKDMRRLVNNMGTIEQPWEKGLENIIYKWAEQCYLHPEKICESFMEMFGEGRDPEILRSTCKTKIMNCPHGRPTMRHLVNLDLIGSNSD